VQREPQAVCDDVAAGRVTREWAAEAYGVIVAGDPGEERVDVAATEERRREIIATRLAEGQPWDGAAAEPDSARPLADGRLSEYVVVEDGEYRVGGVSLGPATRNYKLGALLRDLPLARANPEVRDAKLYVDPEVTFRQVICPETGLLLQTEVVVDGAAPQWDLRPGQTSS
jgi:N-methylhydantoinase B